MKKFALRLFSLLLLISFTVSPAIAQTTQGDRNLSSPAKLAKPTRPEPQLLPQEILDQFRDGMSIDEFLIKNQGPIPNALRDYAKKPVVVVVQLEKPSVIKQFTRERGRALDLVGSKPEQKAYAAQLRTDQDRIIDKITRELRSDITVIGRYNKVLNGFMAQVPAKDINAIRALDGVKSVTRAPKHEINLSASVPLIKANQVWTLSGGGFTGDGVTIAVIDTGIDYTHAMFGGSGDPNDYAANDPDVIETGTFPTAKVIGGYDFAGTAYDAENNPTPVPDDDPLDENGHGTHVASTAAGESAGFGSGVAPDAQLYALKVFGAEGSTNLVVNAIEWAMDPNGDDDMSDHVDVINMSLGSTFGPADVNDPEYQAVEAANAAGVFVVASAGNAGNESYITGSPGNTDSALAVAASTTGFETLPYIVYNDGVEKNIPYTTSTNEFTSTITAELVDVAAMGSANGELCSTAGVSSLAGKIALIKRGACSFEIKVNNADALGAVAAIIYNNAAGVISMNVGASTLPAGSILQTDGNTLKGLAPIQVSVGPDSNVDTFSSATPVDTIADFSSRGPRGFDSMLKPEITAPGVSIYAAKMGGGTHGTSLSGTSMAAPHIAGVAALMKEAHPDWTNEEIKAAMMNTAVDLADPASAEVPRQGAGRVDALASVLTEVTAVGDSNFVSLTWGVVEVGPAGTLSDTKTVTLTNHGNADVTLDVGAAFTSDSDGATLTPNVAQVTVPANDTAQVEFTLDLEGSDLPIDFGDMEEYYGYVTFTGDDADLRLPFYLVPRPYTVIDEDSSVTWFDSDEIGYANLEQTGPVPSDLWAYPVLIVSDNDPNVLDAADLRYVGMDYGGSSPYGDIVIPAFAMWGDAHANQPYWNEVDLYIYGTGGEDPDVVDFNFNYGWFQGSTSNNIWVVVQLDFSNNQVYLASPYGIGADFNSGFQEWYLPIDYNYIEDAFDFEVVSFDWYGENDYAGFASFDLSRLPLAWDLTDPDDTYFLPDPYNEPLKFWFWVDDQDGYDFSQPEGIMLVDYNGKPGVGQAYFWKIVVDPYKYYFTLMYH